MKYKKGGYFDAKENYFEYEINGKPYHIDAHLKLNRKKKRYEFIHKDENGLLTLVTWSQPKTVKVQK